MVCKTADGIFIPDERSNLCRLSTEVLFCSARSGARGPGVVSQGRALIISSFCCPQNLTVNICNEPVKTITKTSAVA